MSDITQFQGSRPSDTTRLPTVPGAPPSSLDQRSAPGDPHDHRAHDESVTDVDEHLHHAVQRVIRYMHEHLADPISADHIAQTANFSKFHFSRVFQRIAGDSPGRYLTNLRFQRAEELLLTTDLKVVEIAYEVGFASVGTFSTRFRRRRGMAPGDYRRRFRTRAHGARYYRPAPTTAIA